MCAIEKITSKTTEIQIAGDADSPSDVIEVAAVFLFFPPFVNQLLFGEPSTRICRKKLVFWTDLGSVWPKKNSFPEKKTLLKLAQIST